MLQNLSAALMLAALLLFVKNIPGLPWWIFTVPVFGLGLILKFMNFKLSGFLVGFITGFLVWFIADFYFDFRSSADILGKLGEIIPIPKFAVMCMAGVIGGLTTGLAFYLGFFITKPSKQQEISIWEN